MYTTRFVGQEHVWRQWCTLVQETELYLHLTIMFEIILAISCMLACVTHKEIQSRSGEYLVLLLPLLIDPSVIMHRIVFKNLPQPASLPPSVNPQVHQ